MNITYEFLFESGRIETFNLAFNQDTMALDPLPLESAEEWTALAYRQCEQCTLDSSKHPQCPVARNLAFVLRRFTNDHSYNPVSIKVRTSDRTIEKQAPLETGVASIMGLIMATSGCPVLDYFRPMAFTHLPFANETETILRAVSTYLMAQYLRMNAGESPDWDLSNLGKLYGTISKINAAFSERVRGLKGNDANVTAVISLDLFAQFGAMTLPHDWSSQIKGLFRTYIGKA